MIVDFVLFMICLLGGFWLFGFSQELQGLQGVVFVCGILLISAGVAYVTRARGGATNRGGVPGSGHREQ